MISNISSLENLFNEIGKELDETVTIYVFGGAALMFAGLKDATKDIDIVIEKKIELSRFTDALKRLGFKTTQITGEYAHLNPKGIYTRENDRFDIFLKIICNKLALSENMIDHSKDKGSYSNLIVKTLSFEDIFLLKSIFSRAGDYEDCVALFQTGINWDMIYNEINGQCKENSFNVWKSYLLERIEDMQQREHIHVPIYTQLKKDYDQDLFPYLTVFNELFKKDLSFIELQKKTELEESLLNNILDLLIKRKKIEKTDDDRYTLTVRIHTRFLHM